MRRYSIEILEARRLLSATLVADINAVGRGSEDYLSAAQLGSLLYLGQQTLTEGLELWQTDGTTAGTRLVKDIRPGPDGSGADQLTKVDNRIFFSASDADYGVELWKTDGTASGTVMVKDIAPYSTGSSPKFLVNINGTLFFAADDGVNGRELWRSDGTAAGTMMVKDINPGASESYIHKIIACNGFAYFVAYTPTDQFQLWRSDGTSAGTKVVKVLKNRASPDYIATAGGKVFITGRDDNSSTAVFASDGTDVGTIRIAMVVNPQNLTAVGNLVYFIDSWSLYKSDGTVEGTQEITDTVIYNSTLTIASIGLGNKLIFVGIEQNGPEIWVSDGTAAGTMELADIRAGMYGSFPGPLAVVGSLVYFSADDLVHGREMWVTDGTPAGTRMLKDIQTGSAGFSNRPAVAFNGRAYFLANEYSTGTQIWSSDGTSKNTRLLIDAIPGTRHSYNSRFTQMGNQLYFAVEGGGNPSLYSLYRSDLTRANTIRLRNFQYPGVTSIQTAGDQLIFSAADAGTGGELFRSDGTPGGTVLVTDIAAGTASSSPANLTVVGNWVYFSANDGVHGTELWRTDGTGAGTMLVADIVAGIGSSSPGNFLATGKVLYFTATDSTAGTELWRSDAISGMTERISDIRSGTASSSPANLYYTGMTLFFAANDGSSGTELWKYQSGAVTRVADLVAGVGSSSPAEFVDFNGWTYFTAMQSSTRYLFRTDGTTANTQLTVPSSSAQTIKSPLVYNNQLYFSGGVSGVGVELLRLDGSNAAVVADIRQGPGSSQPTYFRVSGELLYFTADDGIHGTELWQTDGTAQGTTLVRDLNWANVPVETSIYPAYDYNGRLVITGSDGVTGRELYAISSDDNVTPQIMQHSFVLNQSLPQLKFTFDEPVLSLLSSTALNIAGADAPTPLAAAQVNWDFETRTLTYTFTQAISDGNYTASLPAGAAIDLSGNSSVAQSISFFYLTGDANQDRRVDTADFNVLAYNFGLSEKSFVEGDFDFDKMVTSVDFDVFLSQYGRSLAAVPLLVPAASPFGGVKIEEDLRLGTALPE